MTKVLDVHVFLSFMFTFKFISQNVNSFTFTFKFLKNELVHVHIATRSFVRSCTRKMFVQLSIFMSFEAQNNKFSHPKGLDLKLHRKIGAKI